MGCILLLLLLLIIIIIENTDINSSICNPLDAQNLLHCLHPLPSGNASPRAVLLPLVRRHLRRGIGTWGATQSE